MAHSAYPVVLSTRRQPELCARARGSCTLTFVCSKPPPLTPRTLSHFSAPITLPPIAQDEPAANCSRAPPSAADVVLLRALASDARSVQIISRSSSCANDTPTVQKTVARLGIGAKAGLCCCATCSKDGREATRVASNLFPDCEELKPTNTRAKPVVVEEVITNGDGAPAVSSKSSHNKTLVLSRNSH